MYYIMKYYKHLAKISITSCRYFLLVRLCLCSIKTREVFEIPIPTKFRAFYHYQSFSREWIRKSFPAHREGSTLLNLILPCKWGILIEDIICSWCYYLRSFYKRIIKIGINGKWVVLEFKLLLLHGKNA